MESFGVSQALQQSDNVSQADMDNIQHIADINNKNLQDYLVLQHGEKGDTHEEEQTNLARIGQYGLSIPEKLTEYNDMIKAGGTAGLRGSKLLSKYPSAVASAVADLKARPSTAGLLADTSAPAPVLDTRSGAPPEAPPEELGGHMPQDPVDEHFVPPEADPPPSVPSPEDAVAPVEDAVEEGASSIVKGVAKVGGGLMSAGMLGDDIYKQISQKDFFEGDNTGDKVGNFMNELGSTADILGLATGDPFLALAGVGVGAIGGVVSEVSELFGHKEKEDAKPKPATIYAPPSQNLAGSGAVAQAGASTLKQVQAGAS